MYEDNEIMTISIMVCAFGVVCGCTFLFTDWVYQTYMPSEVWTAGVALVTFFGLLLAAAWGVDKLFDSKGGKK